MFPCRREIHIQLSVKNITFINRNHQIGRCKDIYYGKYKLKVCFTETENGIAVQVLAEEKSGRKLYVETENFFADFDAFRKEQDTLFEVPDETIPELFSWIESRAETGKLLFADFL